MMPGPMGIHKKTGEKMKKEKGMMGDQK
jgi:hypothetical protein